MRNVALVLVLSSVASFASFACASPAWCESPPPGLDPIWARHMEAGLDALALGEPEAAERRFEHALDVARAARLPSDELAFSLYHLAESIRLSLHAPRPLPAPRTLEHERAEQAEALFDEARVEFERAYGPEHPVLMPVYERLASLRARAGDDDGAAALRTAADRIAAHSFPRSHFLRERFGKASPAAILQPLQVLQLVSAPPPESPAPAADRMLPR